MSAVLSSRSGWPALIVVAIALGTAWSVERCRVRDGARFGRAGAPVDVELSADGDRVLVAAADDRAVWVLDAATGRCLARQALDQPPIGLVFPVAPAVPLVLFAQSADTCELHPFRERTLASCFRPGDGDVLDRRDKTPEVLWAAADGDGGVVAALGRFGTSGSSVKLRRYVRDPNRRRWWSPEGSPWIPLPRGLAYVDRWPLAVDPASGRVLLALPGASRMWVFDGALALEREIEIGPDPRDVAVLAGGDAALVADAESGQIWKVGIPAGERRAQAEAGPGARSIALDSRRRLAWVAASYADEIVGLDQDSLATVVRVPVRAGMHSLAIDASGDRLVAASTEDGTVTGFSLTDGDSDDAPGQGRSLVPRRLWEAAP